MGFLDQLIIHVFQNVPKIVKFVIIKKVNLNVYNVKSIIQLIKEMEVALNVLFNV
jgi:hypothetical protein